MDLRPAPGDKRGRARREMTQSGRRVRLRRLRVLASCSLRDAARRTGGDADAGWVALRGSTSDDVTRGPRLLGGIVQRHPR